VEFPKGSYTIREIVDRVEYETPYTIHLPFADEANNRKVLPSSMEIDDIFLWISRYYEENNGVPLHFTKNGSEVYFQKNIKTQKLDFDKLKNKKLTLSGRNWSIKDTFSVVSRQVGLNIETELRDEAEVKTDYNYSCSFGEWIEEVRNYWKHYNGTHLAIRVDDDRLVFVTDGKVRKTLDVQLIGKVNRRTKLVDLENMEKPSLKQKRREAPAEVSTQLKINSQLPQVSTAVAPEMPLKENVQEQQNKSKEKGTKLSKDLITRREDLPPRTLPAKPWQPVDRWIETPEDLPEEVSAIDQLRDWAKGGPLRFMNADNRWRWKNALIQPHPRPESVAQLKKFILPFLGQSRGHRNWLNSLEDLDLSGLIPYERKKLIRDIEEDWLKAALGESEQRPTPKASDSGWHRSYRISAGMGQNAQMRGDAPTRPKASQGQWLEQNALLDYRYNPLGPWKFRYGLSFDHLIASGDAAEELSHSGLGFHFRSLRNIANQGLQGIAPFLHFNMFDDVLTSDGLVKEQQWLTGATLHWASKKLDGKSLKKSMASTDLFISMRHPSGHADRHYLTSESLKQESFGVRHRHAWMGHNKYGTFGPSVGAFLAHRQSPSPTLDGMEFGFDVQYDQSLQKWLMEYGIAYRNWGRTSSVEQWDAWAKAKFMGLGKGIFFTELKGTLSDSSDSLMDYSGTWIKLGWEVQW
jgi:hypothetical protein